MYAALRLQAANFSAITLHVSNTLIWTLVPGICVVRRFPVASERPDMGDLQENDKLWL
jgi:hypothetical protein